MKLEQVRKVLASAPPGYFGANVYDEQEIAAAIRVIHNQSPFRYYGRKCTFEARQFEEEAAAYYGVRHALTTNSGSGALMAAFHALDIGPGAEVLIPGYFWIAISNTILLRGAIPVLCDVDLTLNMDPVDLARKMGPKTRAVVAVHMSGGQADIVEIAKICRRHNVPLLEDFSQCNGGSVAGKKLGSYGDIGVTSLQLNKAITSGEGGLLLTNSAMYAEKAFARSDQGYPRSAGIASAETAGEFVTYGEGRRFNEIAAAIMRVQLAKLPRIASALVESKRAIEAGMRATVACEPRKVVDPAGDLGSTQTIVFREPTDADAFCAAGRKLFGEDAWFALVLKNAGLHVYYHCSNLVRKVPVLPGGFPWNLPENRGTYRYEKGTCPNTDALLDRSVSMVIPPDLEPIHRDARIEAINLAFEEMAGR